MTENPTPAEKRTIDITPLITAEMLQILLQSVYFCRNLKQALVTPAILFRFLATRKTSGKIFGDFLTELKIDPALVDTALRDLVDVKPNKKYRGAVFFDVEIRQALLVSFLLAGNDPATNHPPVPIRPAHFLSALLILPGQRGLANALKISLEAYSKVLIKATKEGPPLTKNAHLGKEYTKDLYEDLAKKEIFDRDNESQELLRILARQKKNNVVLVGEPGVGKKAVVLAALKKIQTDESLNELKGLAFLDLDIQAMSPTDPQDNVPKMLEAEVLARAPAVVVMENMDVFKSRDQVSVFVNFLYNLEEATKARFILPVTPSFYNQFLQGDSIISQSFEKVQIGDLPVAETIKVLSVVKNSIEQFHKVKIDEAVFPDLVSLSSRFLKGEALPQKAISLLEEAASDAAIAGEKEVRKERVLKIISQKTGVPMSSLTISEKEKLLHLEDELGKQVIGQEQAVRAVCEAVRRSRAGLKDPKKPIGSFLFLGATGVGKTELAKALARTVYDSEKAFIRIDMSEYGEQHTTQRLIGSPPGYVGYEEGGQLTNPVLERPYSLILLDEIEKAHPKVFDVFLQVLDDGRLTDSQGRLVDFKNTIIIATSNIAQDEVFEEEQERQEFDSRSRSSEAGQTPGVFDEKLFFEQKIMPKLKEHFRPEFINRFDEIVVFRALNREDLKKIAKIKLAEVFQRLLEKGIKLSVKDETLNKLVAESFDIKFGARPLVRKIREDVENNLAHGIIEGNVKEGDTLEI